MKGRATRTAAQEFDLERFLPYLLNQAAEATSRGFQKIYAEEYGMSRTQWRVLANLGKHGRLTAKDICRISHIEKTKVSRAITALESAGYLRRIIKPDDRRAEELSLTAAGQRVFRDLGRHAIAYDRRLRAALGRTASSTLQTALAELASTAQLLAGKGNASAHKP